MSKLTSRLQILGASLALVAGCLCGCQLQTPQPDPTSASELIERYSALEDKDNYHADGTMDISMELLGMQMPIDAKFSSDMAGKLSHTTISMEMNILGQSQTMEGETYTEEDDGTFYTYSSFNVDGEESWTEATSETNPALSEKLTNADAYKDATFEATEDGYVITMSGEQLANLADTVALDEVLENIGQDIAMTPKEDSEAKLTFDKTFHPISAEIKGGYDIAYKSQETDVIGLGDISMALTMNMDMTFGDYGKVDTTTVTVPDDVKESATPLENAA